MSLLPVEEALRRVLAGITGPVEAETLPLSRCHGRRLAADLPALRTQPPFAASAMDGYAVRAVDAATPGIRLRIVGESAAGRGFRDTIGVGECVRIFTGAPMPGGADAVVLQEDAARDAETVTFSAAARAGRFIREAGLDFSAGAVLLRAGERLDARRLALAAAMGHPHLSVRRQPRVAILATGDELVMPGASVGQDQIVASNPFAIAAMVEGAGGEAIDLGIARDSFAELERGISAARDARADVLVTLGGASVGEHDLVQSALRREGMELGFWRVALRPGKPLMHGRLGSMLLLGLPGNPVSSVVCALLFLLPALRALQGDPQAGADQTEHAILGADLPQNDARQDYLRATLTAGDGPPVATALPVQDSSMLSALVEAGALIVRPPHAPAAKAGSPCRILRLDQVC